ncbi:MAG: phosphotransferase [Clostridia bacterium]|nr:phosphotransferase [Clostridia bacterium]
MSVESRVAELLRRLELGTLIEPPRPVRGGLLHKLYRAVTEEGAYAVKALNPEIMARPHALDNMRNSERAAAAFSSLVPAIAALELNGARVHELAGRYYTVYRWADGQSIFPPEITAAHCAAIGDILGRMHRAHLTAEGISPERPSMPDFDWAGTLRQAKSVGPERAWLMRFEAALDDLNAWSAATRAAMGGLSDAPVISHRDLDPKNVLWHGMEPMVIDWEAAGYVDPRLELLEVILYWADDARGGLTRSLFAALTTAYARHFPLDSSWAAVLQAGRAGTLAWLAYNLRRAMGHVSQDAGEILLGESQVLETLDALYAYDSKIATLKMWL